MQVFEFFQHLLFGRYKFGMKFCPKSVWKVASDEGSVIGWTMGRQSACLNSHRSRNKLTRSVVLIVTTYLRYFTMWERERGRGILKWLFYAPSSRTELVTKSLMQSCVGVILFSLPGLIKLFFGICYLLVIINFLSPESGILEITIRLLDFVSKDVIILEWFMVPGMDFW